MFKYGIKLWTNNDHELFEQALDLFNRNMIDFVELYIHPKSVDFQKLNIFKNIPVTIHATKYDEGFDVSELTENKISLFKEQIIGAADFLKANLIVVHAGIDTKPKIFKKNLKRIFDRRIVVENMPRVSLDNKYFFGYSLKQLEWISKNCEVGICLDVGHATKSAAYEKIDYKDFLRNLFNVLKPSYFHLSGGFYDVIKDEHLNLYDGNIDWAWVKNELKKIGGQDDIRLVFETPKNKNDLVNDLENINYFKKL